MYRINRRLLAAMGIMVSVGLVPRPGVGQQPRTGAPGQPLNITVTSAGPSAPNVSISLGSRSSKVTPVRFGCTHTGGENIDVQQPTPDSVVITMAGVAVAYGGPAGAASASQVFELTQQLSVSFDSPDVKSAKMAVEGRLVGFLRCQKLGSAEVCAGAMVQGGADPGLILTMPPHQICGSENLSINDSEVPPAVSVKAGNYLLTQSFTVSAAMPRSLLPCQAPSAEFAPDPALNPLWISEREPFKGAKKTNLGFQLTIKVAADAVAGK